MATKEKTILVVEDERPLLSAIKSKLERSGFTVVTAESTEQALEQLKEVGKVSAIWLDHYLLGKENGLDLVAKCKQKDSWCKKIPIFAISNTASAKNTHAYQKLGVTKYYVKAEKRLDEIIAEINEALDK
jgi:DNA-binding NtrC family response regulator